MPNSELAEIYFIAIMFVLILIISGVATYFFFKTYYAEMALRDERIKQKKELEKQKAEAEKVTEK